MSVAVALEALKLSRETWSKIPASDRKQILEAVKKRDLGKARRLAQKYHRKFKNPCPRPIHCSICGRGISGTTDKPFKTRMEKLRRHRARKHPTAHKKALEKQLEPKRRNKP